MKTTLDTNIAAKLAVALGHQSVNPELLPLYTEAAGFFYEHAGFSYDPKSETEEEGKIRCAAKLAEAEALASRLGYSFQWSEDAITDSSDFSEEEPAWSLYVCSMLTPDGKTAGCLGGIDFGRDGSPWGQPYRRVVEAELALEIDAESTLAAQEGGK